MGVEQEAANIGKRDLKTRLSAIFSLDIRYSKP